MYPYSGISDFIFAQISKSHFFLFLTSFLPQIQHLCWGARFVPATVGHDRGHGGTAQSTVSSCTKPAMPPSTWPICLCGITTTCPSPRCPPRWPPPLPTSLIPKRTRGYTGSSVRNPGEASTCPPQWPPTRFGQAC